jgi:hypothetical protein
MMKWAALLQNQVLAEDLQGIVLDREVKQVEIRGVHECAVLVVFR